MRLHATKSDAALIAHLVRQIEVLICDPDVRSVYIGRTCDPPQRERRHIRAGRGHELVLLARLNGHRRTEFIETVLLRLFEGRSKVINEARDGRGAQRAGTNYIYVVVMWDTEETGATPSPDSGSMFFLM